jgi:glycosyltransferase involved in cell wall biosynthesis
MSSTPAVSVIIIFFNAERFLREAIDSVLAQSDQDWELILADDGSTDASPEIARSYQSNDPRRVRYIQHEGHQNRGMSPTRNLAARNSRGEWIAFLDADDVWCPNKLEEQRQLLAANPEAGLLYGSPLYWFSWSAEMSRFRDCQPGLGVASDTLVSPPGLLLRNYPLGRGPAPCPSDIIVSRSVFERVGGFEESFGGIYQMYEDQAFLAKVYRMTSVFVSGRCWTKYRQRLDATSVAIRDAGRYREVRRYFLEYLERQLRDENEQNPAIWKAVERAQWPYEHPLLSGAARPFQRVFNGARRRLLRARAAMISPSLPGS